MPDLNRAYDFFYTLEGGMNGALSPSLIDKNQCAFLKDFTVRDGFVKTRPPWFNRLFTFDSDLTESRFTGKFQGACFYDSEQGHSGYVISISGRLFYYDLITDIISEITAKNIVSITQSFTNPLQNQTITVSVTTDGPLTIGETVLIFGFEYTVSVLLTNQVTFTLNTADITTTADLTNIGQNIPLSIATSGTDPLSINGQVIIEGFTYTIQEIAPNLLTLVQNTVDILTTADFTNPGHSSTVVASVTTETPLIAGQTVFIKGFQYTISSLSGTAEQIILTQVTANITTTGFTNPGQGLTVANVPLSGTANLVNGSKVFIATFEYTISVIDPVHNTCSLTETSTDTGAVGASTLFPVIPSGSVILAVVASGADVLAIIPFGATITDASGNTFFEYEVNPDFYDMVYMFPAENYIIILAGEQSPIFFDGSSSRRASQTELPAGSFGVYFNGRIWLAHPDRHSFVAGDIVYGPSGTASNGYRDAILKMTENTFLAGGGQFAVPFNSGPITAMIPQAQVDTSLGVGPLLIGTTNGMFSVNAPADRTVWQNLTYPIQTFSLFDYGPLGPRNTDSINTDIWYRSIDGIRSFLVARRNSRQPFNVPVSREVSPLLQDDDNVLLIYGSSMLLDNRRYSTVNPRRTDTGITHDGLAVINFDAMSTLRNQLPPAWEGLTTGLGIYQVAKGTINGNELGFAFVNNEGVFELWQFNPDGYYDQYTDLDLSPQITRVPIQSALETRAMNFGDTTQLKKLHTCELYLDDIVDNVSITIKYRPDQYPNWTTWQTLALCADKTQCQQAPIAGVCNIWKPNAKGYAARILIPSPDDSVCNEMNGQPMIFGYEFQFRIEVTGHLRIRGFKPHASLQSDNVEGECPTEPVCSAVAQCVGNNYTFDSHG